MPSDTHAWPSWVRECGFLDPLVPDDKNSAMYMVMQRCAERYIEPVAAASTPDALHRGLASPPSYNVVLSSMYEWIASSPRVLELAFLRAPTAASALEDPTLDLYLLPRLLASLTVLCTYEKQGLDVGHALGETMRLTGTILHMSLASSHHQTHARFVLFDAMRCGVRGMVASGRLAPDYMALVGASQPQDELLLCANDPVPEPFTIRHHHRTDAVTQTWLVREAATFRVAPPP